MTWDGSTMRLYVNGALIKSSPMRGSLATSAGALRIGGNAVWGEFFDGTIDELRIYARALPQAELQGDAAQAVASLKLMSRAHAKKKRKGHRHTSKHKRTKLRVHRLSARADHYWHR
jgi:hypothetical protein